MSAAEGGQFAEIGAVTAAKQRGDCGASWAFDVDFEVGCEEPGGLHIDRLHTARIVGNGGVEATVTWAQEGAPKRFIFGVDDKCARGDNCGWILCPEHAPTGPIGGNAHD